MFAAGWQKAASDILFSLQATLQTSPSGHTTSFQMFNHTYKLYSYRLVVEKRAQCSDGNFVKPGRLKCFSGVGSLQMNTMKKQKNLSHVILVD